MNKNIALLAAVSVFALTANATAGIKENYIKDYCQKTSVWSENRTLPPPFLSGGECLCQADFCAELLKKCKEEGINTLISIHRFISSKWIDININT
mgnify:CR=1 FL=1